MFVIDWWEERGHEYKRRVIYLIKNNLNQCKWSFVNKERDLLHFAVIIWIIIGKGLKRYEQRIALIDWPWSLHVQKFLKKIFDKENCNKTRQKVQEVSRLKMNTEK